MGKRTPFPNFLTQVTNKRKKIKGGKCKKRIKI